MLLLLLLLQLPFMVLADDAVTNWTSIEDDWCYDRFKDHFFYGFGQYDDYLSTVPISNDNFQIEINGQVVAADLKFVTVQYMPRDELTPYTELNFTTTNVYEGAIKVILNHGEITFVPHPYQELPVILPTQNGTPKGQPLVLDVLHIIADETSGTCNVSRLDTIYITVQHLALPEIDTFEACNICNNDTYHRMDWNENGLIPEFGYEAECPEIQRLALDGRLSEKNCREQAGDSPPIFSRQCSCLYSNGKTREEEQKDWKESGVKAFTTGVESVVLLWLITAFLFD
ncbi:hypothetical protein FRACYDRAFT_277879 [Fragilariopsis cylindrus CCMP1102]|uniref:Uncharacterized protein n=1 Tax=Fragilariopsis cylindrus CCMP1102 TaxID=635003 RepID=A0A1E7EMT0_9STRA|nr:hypothetical protein FRACYDRAFT_277879 [Fragilariopsis cylindrus CCMP1102]|eukprot:OEU07147.1 hypothetical protein FRACYDRAFT_277879 [Fragilariopsis cylindrus CCMP1102]